MGVFQTRESEYREFAILLSLFTTNVRDFPRKLRDKFLVDVSGGLCLDTSMINIRLNAYGVLGRE